ncbi:MAG: hypothetical protein ACE14T_12250 [Syntrophales bacterium]
MKMLRRWLKQRIINEMSAIEKKNLIEEVYGTLKSFDQRDVLNRIKPAGSHLHRNPKKRQKEAA